VDRPVSLFVSPTCAMCSIRSSIILKHAPFPPPWARERKRRERAREEERPAKGIGAVVVVGGGGACVHAAWLLVVGGTHVGFSPASSRGQISHHREDGFLSVQLHRPSIDSGKNCQDLVEVVSSPPMDVCIGSQRCAIRDEKRRLSRDQAKKPEDAGCECEAFWGGFVAAFSIFGQ
jgi:hypothetical protein